MIILDCSQQSGGVAETLASFGDTNAGSNPYHCESFFENKIFCDIFSRYANNIFVAFIFEFSF